MNRLELADRLRLMAVTDDAVFRDRDLVGAVAAAVRGGVTIVQLRLKRVTPRELVAITREMIAAVPVPVIVNDRLDVALAAGAAGVHLGADDIPPARARGMAPAGFVIGASVGSMEEVAAGLGADFWGIGPWRATATKSEAGEALGAVGFAALAGRSEGRPCIAIGSVGPDDVAEVLRSGGVGVAAISGLFLTPDVEEAARRYRLAERPR